MKDYSSSSPGNLKDETLEESQNAKHNDLEDIVYKFEITYDEIINTLDLKYNRKTTKGYTLPPGMYKIIDINFMLKSLLPNEVQVNKTVDDVRLRSNLTLNKTIRFSKKNFSITI